MWIDEELRIEILKSSALILLWVLEGLTCLGGQGMLSRLFSLPWTSLMLSCSARTVPNSHMSNSWDAGRLPFDSSAENNV